MEVVLDSAFSREELNLLDMNMAGDLLPSLLSESGQKKLLPKPDLISIL